MQQGYGFGGEGDWKTAALLRILKVMGTGLKGGTSFMEDYTYNFQPGNDLVVGSHMLEVCPSIAKEEKPLLDVQHLGIGGKADPARLIFSTPAGPALNASLIDMGNRFRLLVNVVDTVEQPHHCQNYRLPGLSGKHNLHWQRLLKLGSSPVAHTIRYSHKRWVSMNCVYMPKCTVLNSC